MGTSSSTEMRKIQFKLHVAIDFGTDGCALAFAYKNKVTTYNKFKGARRTNKVKTKTHILLNEENNVASFGNNAKFTYKELSGDKFKSWMFFERFKMALYDDELTQQNLVEADDQKDHDGIDTKLYLKAANGKYLKSQTVFVLALKKLRELAMEFIPRITKENISDDEIQWIVTVPAIWSDKAKDQMKKWVFKAGLADEYISDQCVVVYEPDCASLAIQKEYSQNEVKDCEAFQPGDKYVLVDAGGGTIDIVCHKVLADGFVEELVYPTGGQWGSCYIDDLYCKLLENIFSKDWMEEFRKESPTGYVEVMDSFEHAKTTFYENLQAPTHSVELPFEFLQFLDEKCGALNTKPENKINEFSRSIQYFRRLCDVNIDNKEEKEKVGETCILRLVTKNANKKYNNPDEYLEMDTKIWKCLFDAKLDPTILHIKKLLKIDGLQKQCKYLLLAGGFSGSLYFQQKMKQAFGETSRYKLKVIIPISPLVAVVQGAAWMGITKHYIKSRILRYTYGVEMYFNKQLALEHDISEEYIEKNTASDGFVMNCFKIVARKGERINLNEVKKNTSYRRSKTSLIPVLYSDQKEPKIRADGHQLAVLTIPHFDDNKQIITEFHFYGTEIKVYSYAKTNPEAKKSVKITYVK